MRNLTEMVTMKSVKDDEVAHDIDFRLREEFENQLNLKIIDVQKEHIQDEEFQLFRSSPLDNESITNVSPVFACHMPVFWSSDPQTLLSTNDC